MLYKKKILRIDPLANLSLLCMEGEIECGPVSVGIKELKALQGTCV